jgi:hypothetical protein
MMAVSATAAAAPHRSAVPFFFVVVAMGLLTVAALTVEPFAALGVPLMAAAAYALYRLPLKVSALGLFGLAIFCEGLEIPLALGWMPPGHSIAQLLLVNLSTITGVGALRAPLIDLLTLGLFAMASFRDRSDGWTSRLPTVRPMNVALLGTLITLLVLDLIGAARGGNVNESLWQIRQILLFPVRAIVLLRALDGTIGELKGIARMLIIVGVAKALIGIYFMRFVVLPSGRDVEFTTSHNDTLLFVPLLGLFLNLMIERFTWKNMLSCLPWVAIVLYGMICNDRRLAYVSFAFGAAASLLLAPWTRFKKILFKSAVYGAPFFALYTLAGWGSTGGGFFFFARLARSLIVGDPTQVNMADYRDLENVDVLNTWADAPIVPNGYGHKMDLLFPLPDISNFMPTWQYHPHNQYLWTMANAGPFGFTLLMMPHVVTLYLAARTYRMTDNLYVRVAMLTCIGTVIAVFSQWYGDMGALSGSVSWMAAICAALACRWAVRTGAWPTRSARSDTVEA